LLQARRQMRGLSHGGVIHPEIAPDGADDDLARVEPDPDVQREPVPATHCLGVAPDRCLHVERRITGPHAVVLVSDGRPEQRHDPIA
jgi:hypothetical protein